MGTELNVERCYLVTRNAMGRTVNVAVFGLLEDAEHFAGGLLNVRLITKAQTVQIETEKV